jgi:AAA domain
MSSDHRDYILYSACAAIASAKGMAAKLQALKKSAIGLSGPVRHGFLTRQDAVDALYKEARDCGLLKDPVLAPLMPGDDDDSTENVVLHIIGEGLDTAPLLLPPGDEPWWRDPEDIPPRSFLFDRHYIRRSIGATIGGGGRGKTTLSHVEAVSMAVGRNLLTGEELPDGPLRVWSLNGEEDQDELDRRVAATCQHYSITRDDLGGRLWVKSVRDQPMRVAILVKSVPVLNQFVVEHMTGFIERNSIDVFMLDPFVSFHGLAENDNMHMDLLLKEGLGAIANRTNSAGEIFHHPGKPKLGQFETSVDDLRGASAILWAVRAARVLNFMTAEEATKLGISDDERKLIVRIANGKANMGPLGTAKWVRFEVEKLVNGDEIACSSHWSANDPFEGVTTAHMRLCTAPGSLDTSLS